MSFDRKITTVIFVIGLGMLICFGALLKEEKKQADLIKYKDQRIDSLIKLTSK